MRYRATRFPPKSNFYHAMEVISTTCRSWSRLLPPKWRLSTVGPDLQTFGSILLRSPPQNGATGSPASAFPESQAEN